MNTWRDLMDDYFGGKTGLSFDEAVDAITNLFEKEIQDRVWDEFQKELKKKEKGKMTIEISYTTEEDGDPEHYAYCDSIEEAHDVLRDLEEQMKRWDDNGC